MRILQLTVHFRPNIGGVETHLDDLCKALVKKGFKVLVLAYRPLQTKTNWQVFETDKNIEIIRIPWVPNFFYKLANNPILEFLYLTPGIFFILPFILLIKKTDVIHAHGLVAGFVGVVWGKLFNKRVVVSTHSIYHFPKVGLYRKFASWIFESAQCCLGLSKQSVHEIKSLEISKKVNNFTYWIDLQNFQKIEDAKEQLGWTGKFVVLFVGRLVEVKGLKVLIKAVRKWNKKIVLAVVGTGPLESEIRSAQRQLKNLQYIGPVSQSNLPLYYSGSDILIVPSVSEEGFGRVILESLACGTPVIGSSRGGIAEAIDETVGKLIDISPENIKQAVEDLYENRSKLELLAGNCRRFAERRFSEKNAETIIKAYKD